MFKQRRSIFILIVFFVSLSATPCKNPAVASDDLSKKFRYGCFCGQNYPAIEHPSKKSYRKLNQAQREELILQYQKIDAYDDIDAICKEHDICYIRYGKEAKVCNNRAYKAFSSIAKKFDKVSKDDHSNEECRNLAYDMGSIFHTIFLPADDEDRVFDFGILMLNGAITVTNRMLEESVDRMRFRRYSRYPSKNRPCFLEDLNSTTSKEKNHIKIITIHRD